MDAYDRLSDLARVYRMQETGRAKHIRERARISLRTLARALKVQPEMLSRWEKNEAQPREANALRWLTALDALADVTRDDDHQKVPAETGA
jgi:transcriptional regulator with XRE-family HTH domain